MSQRPEHSPDSAEIRQGVIRLARRLSAERPADGLSLNKSSVLGHLRRGGPMPAGALAAADHQQPQSLTRVFAELQRDGLISRSRDSQDGRQRVLELTDAGRRALAEDMAQRDAWLDVALDDLSPTERQVLLLAAGLMNRLADSPAAVPGSTAAVPDSSAITPDSPAVTRDSPAVTPDRPAVTPGHPPPTR
ncbi:MULTISPECIES: MarR family winged helix-turn-helix transcriptional regulator [Streptomyces]|uniref:MarR family winged helix-turn-helix transcriptional regulator n=2 Tax=Streptomyces TaxID=1883 RepID=A0ABV9J1F8_9ACTN